jgi:hypothetical protein
VLSALLPAITHTPADLVAANVVTSLVEYIGMMLGPLIGGIILAESSAAWVFIICGAVTANSALMSLRLRLVRPAVEKAAMRAREVVGAVWAGLGALRAYSALGSLMILISIGGIVRGVTDVLMVLFAEARLAGGGGEAGALGTGSGVGAIAGAVVAAGLIGRARIAPYLAASSLLFAAAFVALGGTNTLVLATVMFGLFGLAESLLRVTSAVGVQRLSPDDFLARIFGVSEGIQMAAMAIGSVAVSLIVQAMGLGPALVTLGGAFMLSMVWTTVRFRQHGGDVPPPPADVIDRLLMDPVFEHLATPALSRLAMSLERIAVGAGEAVITEGELGDRYYLIVDGEVEVTVGGQLTRVMGPGASFGEIALLRDVPRTATVTCLTDVILFAVGRDDFLQAVTGHPRSMAAAAQVAHTFLGDQPDRDDHGR